MDNHDPEKALNSDSGLKAQPPRGSWSPNGAGDSHESLLNSAKNQSRDIRALDAAQKEFIDRLSEQERMLILLKKELYEGSWQAMLNDLNNRLEGKPFIFKLANRIRDDIERIDKLKNFEMQYHVDLADFIEPPKM